MHCEKEAVVATSMAAAWLEVYFQVSLSRNYENIAYLFVQQNNENNDVVGVVVFANIFALESKVAIMRTYCWRAII